MPHLVAKMKDNAENSLEMQNLLLRHNIMGLELRCKYLENQTKHYERQSQELIYILLALEKEVTEGSIAEHLPFNPQSIPAIKHIRKYFDNDEEVEQAWLDTLKEID